MIKIHQYHIIIFIAIYLLIILTQSLQHKSNPSITLYYHQWCKKSANSIKIIDKLSSIFHQQQLKSKIKFNKVKIQQEKQQQLLSSSLYQKHLSKIHTYPTIIFDSCIHSNSNSNNQQLDFYTYQNNLNVIQLTYWIKLNCFKIIPQCTKKLKQNLPIYQFPQIIQFQLKQNIIQWINSNPAIRICTNITLNDKLININFKQMLDDILQVPLYFDNFNHNIRNYLIKTQKIAIVSVTHQIQQFSLNNRNFKQYFHRITNFKNQSLTNTGFKLNQSIFKKIIFISIPLFNKKGNQNKIGFKLIQFLDESPKNDFIVAIRFKNGQFFKKIYDFNTNNEQIIKGNKFSYWINQMLELGQKQNQKEISKKQVLCSKDYIIYRYSHYSLQQIQSLVRLQKTLQQQRIQIDINKMKRKQWSVKQGKGIVLCIQGKKPMRDISTNQTILIIKQALHQRQIQEKEKMQYQEEQQNEDL